MWWANQENFNGNNTVKNTTVMGLLWRRTHELCLWTESALFGHKARLTSLWSRFGIPTPWHFTTWLPWLLTWHTTQNIRQVTQQTRSHSWKDVNKPNIKSVCRWAVEIRPPSRPGQLSALTACYAGASKVLSSESNQNLPRQLLFLSVQT